MNEMASEKSRPRMEDLPIEVLTSSIMMRVFTADDPWSVWEYLSSFAALKHLMPIDLWLQRKAIVNIATTHAKMHHPDELARLGLFVQARWFVECGVIPGHRDFSRYGAVNAAAEGGHLDMLEWLLAKFPYLSCTTAAFDVAARNGRLDILRVLESAFPEVGCTTDAMDEAAENGHLEVVRFLHAHRHEGCTSDAMDMAADGGHLEVVRFLHAHRHEGCTGHALDLAARNGHLDVVRFLYENRFEGSAVSAAHKACFEGRADVFFYLVHHCMDSWSLVGRRSAYSDAVAAGCADIVDWFHRHVGMDDLDTDFYMVDMACRANAMPVVKSLCELRGMGCTGNALVWASTNGNGPLVRYLVESQRCVCPDAAVDRAAANGHLEIVRYLHVRAGGACTEAALDAAAANGHLAVVEYLDKRMGAMATSDAMDGAARQGHLHVVEYLEQNRKEGCNKALAWALENGHYGVAQFLARRRLGIAGLSMASLTTCILRNNLESFKIMLRLMPASKLTEGDGARHALDAAARHRRFDFVKILWDRGMRPTLKTLMNAVLHGCMEVIRFLVETCGVRVTSNRIVDVAASRGYIKICEYLLSLPDAPRPSQTALRLAVWNNELNAVKWLCEATGTAPGVQEAANAAAHGNLELLQWMVETKGIKPSCKVCTAAASFGQVDVLRYLASIEAPFSRYTLIKSAEVGSIDCVAIAWKALKNKIPTDALYVAAACNRFDVLRWMLSKSKDIRYDKAKLLHKCAAYPHLAKQIEPYLAP